MSAPEISVVVLNYNGRAWLDGCLRALDGQYGAPPFETILVDNASSDGSVEFVRARFPAVRLHETGRNLGFAAGNNAGARLARGRWLAFLNNDTIAAPDWLARLHAAVAERPGYALATSCLVFLDDPGTVDSAGDGYVRAGGAFKRGYRKAVAGYQQSQEVFGACGAAFLIRREVFEALGGFDDAYFMVYEDVDLSYRARLLGHRCWYAADAVVHHAVSATLGRASALAVFHGQRNLEWTWIKNTPARLLWRSLVPHAIYSAAGLLHYARTGLAGPALKGKLSAFAGLPAALAARRRIQSAAVGAGDIDRLMERRWLALKREEKQTQGR